ncbi:WGR domain-containing protein [Nocardia altamirensis]|uniref:WGR domain-containing protein n=1 Tax=Nocardia altamirensis TaxID=472158 RepID=UPI0008402A9B|nr:WGR domain-containing protein [Nocardia altamirensis]
MPTTATVAISEQILLVKVAAEANNNKFYELILRTDGMVIARYGRVGSPKGQIKEYTGGQTTFAKKLKEKCGEGYRIVQNDQSSSDALSPSVVQSAAKAALGAGDPITDELVDLLASVNRHTIQVQSGGLITPTASGGMETALGPVSPAAVAAARLQLDAAAHGDIDAVNEYLMLVPQQMPRARGWEHQFSEPRFLADQRDFLDQLDAAVRVGSAGAAGARAQFRYRLEHVADDSAKVAQLRRAYERTRDRSHDCSALQLHRVWTVTDTTGTDTWAGLRDQLGNVQWLWHGSQPENVLSILARGLYCPPTTGSSIRVTGRMFGDGIYLSDHSTKALNYSYGYWAGTRTRHTRCFMLSAQVVMGNELTTTASDTPHGVVARMRHRDAATGQPYHSLNVRAGTCRVYNNEMIVPDPRQIRLRYLAEFR